MRTLLAKFRSSLALDSSVPHRAKLPRGQGRPDDIMHGEASLHSLDQRLRAAHPATPVPAALHSSVMRAVRAATESQERQWATGVLRWRLAPALAMLVFIGLWLSLNRSPQELPSLTIAAIALQQSHEITQKAPNVVLAPLAQEMNNLNRDFQSVVDFLAASVP